MRARGEEEEEERIARNRVSEMSRSVASRVTGRIDGGRRTAPTVVRRGVCCIMAAARGACSH